MDDISGGLLKLRLALTAAQSKLTANAVQDSSGNARNDTTSKNSADQPSKSVNPGEEPKNLPEQNQMPGNQNSAKVEEIAEQKATIKIERPNERPSEEDSVKTDSKTTLRAEIPGSVPTDDAPQKSKAQLKAELRAIQEAQRAAKEAAKAQGAQKLGTDTTAGSSGKPLSVKSSGPGSKPQKGTTESLSKGPTQSAVKTAAKVGQTASSNLKASPKPSNVMREGLIGPFRFPHLALPADEDDIFGEVRHIGGNLHPSVIQLGLQSLRGIFRGSSIRALALINALHEMVSDFEPPPGKDFKRDFDTLVLKPNLAFLGRCRPLSLSMKNVVENFRHAMSYVGGETSDFEARRKFKDHLEEAGRVILAARCEIQEVACTKIKSRDVILVYGYDSLVTSVLQFAWKEGERFKVMIVDSSPDFEGKLALEELTSVGVTCGYCLVNALQPAMSEVTKVFLGAEAVMNNGAIMARIGSCQVAQIANVSNVPVLVFCETFKFCETVQTDSFHFNELGPEQEMLRSSPIASFRKRGQLLQPAVKTEEALGESTKPSDEDNTDLAGAFKVRMLNLKYDVMPAEFVTALVTEMGILPPASVPVVNRETFLRR